MRRSLLVDKTYIAGNDTLEHNLSGARDRRRRDHGYITPEDAAAFLHKERSSTLEQLMIEVRYDPLTALHLAAMTRQTQSPLPKEPPCRSQPAGDIKSTQGDDVNASVELDA